MSQGPEERPDLARIPQAVGDGPWWRELTRYHWWVLIVATLGWLFDGMDQRIFILRGHRLVAAVANETDHPMDLAALNRVIATAIATRWR